MVYIGVLLIVYIVEMLTAYVFFSQAGEKKRRPIYCILIGMLLFLSALLVNVFGGNIVWLNMLYFTLTNITFGCLSFKINWKKIIVYSIILVTISMIWEYATEFILSAVTETAIKTYLEDNIILILIASISKSLYFISALVLSKFIVKEKRVTNVLAEATAKAVQRIPDARCNGDMTAALEQAQKIQREEKEFLINQGVAHIFNET